jgi:hypothetical protein
LTTVGYMGRNFMTEYYEKLVEKEEIFTWLEPTVNLRWLISVDAAGWTQRILQQRHIVKKEYISPKGKRRYEHTEEWIAVEEVDG